MSKKPFNFKFSNDIGKANKGITKNITLIEKNALDEQVLNDTRKVGLDILSAVALNIPNTGQDIVTDVTLNSPNTRLDLLTDVAL